MATLEELMQREYDLAVSTVEDGGSVIPYVVAESAEGRCYIIPFAHAINSADQKAAWSKAFRFFAAMKNISRYVMVSEAWEVVIDKDNTERIEEIHAKGIADAKDRTEVLSILGVDQTTVKGWKCEIVRDGSLAVCNNLDKQDDAEEVDGTFAHLLPPEKLVGKMPDAVKPTAYEIMRIAGFEVISR